MVIAVALGWWGVNLRLETEKKVAGKLEAEVKALSDRAITGWKLKYVAGKVAGALNERFEYGRTFDLVNNFLGMEAGVVNMELKGERQFVVAGRTDQKEVIDSLEKKVIAVEKGEVEGFSAVSLTGLDYRGGTWFYSLKLELK